MMVARVVAFARNSTSSRPGTYGWRCPPCATTPGGATSDETLPYFLTTVVGQHQVARTTGHIKTIRLVPQEPPACPQTLTAVAQADWVILGPGSWFTSVLPHLLVPSLRRALHLTAAKRVLTLNLELQTRETLGYSAAAHLESLREHAPELRFDIVLADQARRGIPGHYRAAVGLTALGAGVAALGPPPRVCGATDRLGRKGGGNGGRMSGWR